MPDYSIDMIKYAADQKPNDFVNAFNSMMHTKVHDAIAAYKVELQKSYMGSKEQSEPEEVQPEAEESTDENAETNS